MTITKRIYNCFSRYYEILRKEYPMYKDVVLKMSTRVFTQFRVRAMNKVIRLQRLKNRKKKTAKTDEEPKGRKRSAILPRAKKHVALRAN